MWILRQLGHLDIKIAPFSRRVRLCRYRFLLIFYHGAMLLSMHIFPRRYLIETIQEKGK
jgi:hypothetical protein